MRKPIIAGNWKMFKTVEESVNLATALVPLVCKTEHCEVVICPTFTALASVKNAIDDSCIKIGGQNLYWEKEGAFTGEISGPMLKSAGCDYVLIGHSERRQYFGETDATVNKKIFAALDNGLKAIVCIGETLQERESNNTFKVIEKQVKDGLKGLTAEQWKNIVIAYEPVWAIGTGKTASKEQAQEVHAFIRKELATLFGAAVADGARILYGGSVKPENVKELMSQSDIDGALVGGAALKAESFAGIVHFNK
jgi:triosephosphate isomerase